MTEFDGAIARARAMRNAAIKRCVVGFFRSLALNFLSLRPEPRTGMRTVQRRWR